MGLLFLSTPSARRATERHRGRKAKAAISIHALREEGDFSSSVNSGDKWHFYPRPPRGGRRRGGGLLADGHGISIHALREEGDRLPARGHQGRTISIHALREEGDAECPIYYWYKEISIHALREEGDRFRPEQSSPCSYFYPRPPRGGRQQKQRQNLYFQTNYTTFCTNLEEL